MLMRSMRNGSQRCEGKRICGMWRHGEIVIWFISVLASVRLSVCFDLPWCLVPKIPNCTIHSCVRRSFWCVNIGMRRRVHIMVMGAFSNLPLVCGAITQQKLWESSGNHYFWFTGTETYLNANALIPYLA